MGALARALKDEDENIRFTAAEALGRIGPDAKSAIPDLSDALMDEDEDVRYWATEALWRIRGE